MKKLFVCVLLFSIAFFVQSQTVKVLTSGTRTSLRGLSAVDDSIVWVSGSGGMVARSTDGGISWKWLPVKGFEKTDFRDIEAFDANTAIIMGVDSPAFILKTIDGGVSWTEIYRNDTHGIFLDAMEVDAQGRGYVVGDPLESITSPQHFFLLHSRGNFRFEEMKGPTAEKGEACFASSGTNIRKYKNRFVLVSGGMASSFFLKSDKTKLPLLQGTESTGANSIAVKNKKQMIIVGGDFNKKDAAAGNCAITVDGGRSWSAPQTAPHGYRSCIEYLYGKTWITCGLNGVDITIDDGRIFTQINKEGFHVCRKSKAGNAVFLAGGNGRIAKLL